MAHPPKLFATISPDGPKMNRHRECAHWPNRTDITCDDGVTMPLQYSTRWDSLWRRGELFDADDVMRAMEAQKAELATALAQRKRTAFLLTAPPLRLPGAVGSPVTPVATI